MPDTSAWKPVDDVSAWTPVPEEKPSATSRFASNTWEEANPVSVLRGMGESMLHPINTIRGYLKQNADLADKAEAAFKRGDAKQGLTHLGSLILQVVPGLGAKANEAGEQIDSGDVAGGLGKATGAALGVIEASELPRLARGAATAIHATPEVVKAAGAKVADIATSPGVVKGLQRSSEGAIVGSAMHGNIPGVAVGTVARIAAEKLADIASKRAKAAVPVEVVDPLLNDIAQGMGGKDFAKLDPSAQQTVRDIAARMKAKPAPRPVETPAEAAPPIPEPVAEAAPEPVAEPVAQPEVAPVPEPAKPFPVKEAAQLLKERFKGPSATPNEPVARLEATPAPVAAGPEPVAAPTAVQSAAEALRAEMEKNGSLPEPSKPGIPSAVYESEARHLKADAVAKALHENGISAADAEAHFQPENWKALFEGVGEHEPGKFSGDSKLTIGQTIVKLKALERAAKPKPAPVQKAPVVVTEPQPMTNPKALAAAEALKAAMDEPTTVGEVMKRTRKPRKGDK